MEARDLRCVLAAAALAAAMPPLGADSAAPSCDLPATGTHPLEDRAGILAEYERLPHACLDEIFSACSLAANESLLDFQSAAICSFGYEALLEQRFGGNFRALLAWWLSQRPRTLQ